jgi:hypothetical protein
MQLLALSFWLGSFPLLWWFLRKQITSPQAVLLLGLVALHPVMIGFSVMVMSESAFLFFTLLALYFFQRWSDTTSRRSWWLLLAFAATCALLMLIRTVGFAMILAAPVYLLLQKRFRDAGKVTGVLALAIGAAALALSGSEASLISTGYQSFVLGSSVLTKLGHVATNLGSYFGGILGDVLIPLGGPPSGQAEIGGALSIRLAMSLVVATFLLVGFVRSLRRFQLGDVYFIIYAAGILSFWGNDVNSAQLRYLLPILPFLYVYFLEGFSTVAAWLKLGQRWVPAGVAVLILLVGVMQDLRAAQGTRLGPRADLMAGAVWIRANTAANAMVLCRDPIPTYLYARRQTVGPQPGEGDVGRLMDRAGVDYVLLSPPLPYPQPPGGPRGEGFFSGGLEPYLTDHPDRFRLVYEERGGDSKVFEVAREAPSAAGP